MKRTYKGITFPEGYNKTFGEFKADFEDQHIFANIPHKEREKALKEAHGIATKGNDVKDVKLSTAASKGTENNG